MPRVEWTTRSASLPDGLLVRAAPRHSPAQPRTDASARRPLSSNFHSKTTSDDLPPPERLPAPGSLVKSKTESEKIAGFLTGLAEKSGNPDAVSFVKKFEPALKAVIKGFLFVWPYYKLIYSKAYEYYHKLPENILYMVFGVALCFFGGTYVGAPRYARASSPARRA